MEVLWSWMPESFTLNCLWIGLCPQSRRNSLLVFCQQLSPVVSLSLALSETLLKPSCAETLVAIPHWLKASPDLTTFRRLRCPSVEGSKLWFSCIGNIFRQSMNFAYEMCYPFLLSNVKNRALLLLRRQQCSFLPPLTQETHMLLFTFSIVFVSKLAFL